MDDAARIRLRQLVVKVQEALVEIHDLRDEGNFQEVSGLFEMHAAVAENSLSTAVLMLQVIGRVHDSKDSGGEPQIVGQPVVAPTPEPAAPALTDTILPPDREACEECAAFPDPPEGTPIRLCPSCGRRLPRNRRA
jgi:hypothetical protein